MNYVVHNGSSLNQTLSKK